MLYTYDNSQHKCIKYIMNFLMCIKLTIIYFYVYNKIILCITNGQQFDLPIYY